MTRPRRFERIYASSLPGRIYDALRTSIFSGKLPPGAPLREQLLAREFGVSQNSVREALVRLQHDGLVERLPNRATFVTMLSNEEIGERVAVRLALEEMASLAAAKRLSPADFEELARRLRAINVAVAGNHYSAFASADLEFHRFLWDRSGNRTLYRQLDQITAPLFAFLNILQHDRRVNLPDATHCHELIIHALRSRDQGLIRDTIRTHVESGYRLLIQGAGATEALGAALA